MAEKVIHEVRFIETDDGFRIEVKGDKESLRKMGCGPGMGFGPGPGFRSWRWGRRGPGKHRHGHGFGPWAWGWWAEEDEEDFTAEEPPKDA